MKNQKNEQSNGGDQLNNSVIVYSNNNIKLNQESNASIGIGNVKFINSQINNTLIVNTHSKKDLIVF